MTSTSDILYRAAEILGEHGHCKGSLRDSEGRVYAVGAIVQAEQTYPPSEDVVNAVDVLDSYVRDVYHVWGTPAWNDNPSTSAEDVILTLKTVAAENEEKA